MQIVSVPAVRVRQEDQGEDLHVAGGPLAKHRQHRVGLRLGLRPLRRSARGEFHIRRQPRGRSTSHYLSRITRLRHRDGVACITTAIHRAMSRKPPRRSSRARTRSRLSTCSASTHQKSLHYVGSHRSNGCNRGPGVRVLCGCGVVLVGPP